MKKAVLSLLLTLTVLSAVATECPNHFAAGREPKFANPQSAGGTQEVCYQGFAVLHSGLSKTPLLVAEHLTAERIDRAREQVRRNAFHPENRLPAGDRAELNDYVRSGYDRGHLAPNGDMPDESSQYEAFTLANIIPQNATLNQHLWEGIESSVRDLAKRRHELYVITGVLFVGSNLHRIGGRVLVPTHVFKVVYLPRTHEAAAYLTKNEATREFQKVSLAEIERLSGFRLLPGIAAEIVRMLDLPEPREHASKSRHSANATTFKRFLHL